MNIKERLEDIERIPVRLAALVKKTTNIGAQVTDIVAAMNGKPQASADSTDKEKKWQHLYGTK